MKIVGITGGIGSGKSKVSQYIRSLGFPVYNSDLEAKKLVNTDPKIKQKIINLFGKQAYDTSGNYDAKYMSQIVFNNQKSLEELNQIIHPAVSEHFNRWKEKQSDIVFKETALLFELNLDSQCDKTILVTADENIRIQRVMQRDGRYPGEIQKIIQKQMPDDEKRKKSDFIIENNSSLSDLENRVKNVLDRIMIFQNQ